MSKIEKEVYEDRTVYRLNGKYHREDGPAIKWIDGTKSWYRNGLLHRENGPARIWSNGTKSWFQNGNLHREDGPAIEHISGYKAWYLNDKKVDFWAVWNLDDDKERKKRLCFYLHIV